MGIEDDKMMADVKRHGTGYLLDGKHIPYEEVVLMGTKAEEDKIEQYLCKRANEEGYLPLKYEPEGSAHWPDRLLLGKTWAVYYWVECKAPNGELSPGQVAKFKTLEQKVYIVSSKEEVDEFFKA